MPGAGEEKSPDPGDGDSEVSITDSEEEREKEKKRWKESWFTAEGKFKREGGICARTIIVNLLLTENTTG